MLEFLIGTAGGILIGSTGAGLGLVVTPLLILEAMKMQNEITSPLSGLVKSILVKEGTSVKKDAMLMMIE